MIITAAHTTTASVKDIGGKAANLLKLKQLGYDVPDFIIITAASLEYKYNLQSLTTEIAQYFNTNTLLAVRSSADVEDGSSHSFAGQFTTLLNVPVTALQDAIEKVAASVNAPTVKAYLLKNDLPIPKMSVIVQEMVDADFAGVAFGINPVTGDETEQVVNIVEGLGEDLVNGSKTGDAYAVKNGKIVQKACIEKEIATDAQVLEVSQLVVELSKTYGAPQDIEFAFTNGTLKLLQARPVTTQAAQEKIVYDNSNIIESYPDLTLPLTFSFIEKMYSAVYTQLSAVLGIAKHKVQQHKAAYDSMLGLLNGRVYYNLNSWYTTLSLLPGYNLNAGYMEAMMGVKNKPEILVRPTPRSSFRDYIDLINAVAHIIYNAATVRKQKQVFIQDFDSIYQRFATKDYSNTSAKEILNDYQTFETMMSAKWKAPLVNDFFAMIYFGLLQKQCAKYLPEQQGAHNMLLASSKDIITTQPLKLLPALATELMQDAAIKDALLHKEAPHIWQLLQQAEYALQKNAVMQYINTWGERCVAELKLETITYKQAPERLIEVLKQYAQNNLSQSTFTFESKNNTQEEILSKLKGKPIKKALFKHILKQARYLVSNRENLRYYRTLGFGMVRTIMIAIGEKLAANNQIENARDIFLLQLQEVKDTINETTGKDIKQIVAFRKRDYQLYASLPLPERVITNGKQTTILTDATTVSGERTDELKGIPCSPGVIRATICKVASADAAFPKQQIMATYATDPGYVVMFAGTTGILTERGSLLSHAAIVSREMNIPCIVGITGLMEQLNDGDEVIMDGSTGIVKILNRHT